MLPSTGTYPEPAPVWTAIPGWFDYADVYRNLTDRCQNGDVVVEVGCYLGRSACCWGEMIQTSQKKVTLLAVDIWPSSYTYADGSGIVIESPFETFYANVRQSGLTKIIVPIRAPSLWAATFVRNDLTAVFIDAEHDYDNCLADIRAWLPKVKHGGLLVGHDYDVVTFPGVVKAAQEVFGSSLLTTGRCWYVDVP